MIPVFIVIVTFFIYFLVYAIRSDELNSLAQKVVVTLIATLFVGVVSVLFVPLVSSGIMEKYTSYRDTKDHIKIYSLSSGVEAVGNFYLGCGSTQGVEYYYYYINNGEGFRRDKVPVKKSVIIEGDKDPEIAIEKTHLPDWVTPWWVIGIINDAPYYRIHVPKGTVVQQFSVK